MADLSVNFAGIKSPNPFWLASAPPTNMGSMIECAFVVGHGSAEAIDALQMGKLAAQGISFYFDGRASKIRRSNIY